MRRCSKHAASLGSPGINLGVGVDYAVGQSPKQRLATAVAERVKLQILVRPAWRSDEGARQVREHAEALGMRITASGLATLSAEMKPEDFETLFKTSLRRIPPRPPGKADFGHSGGFAAEDLQVPTELQEFIESISVALPHLRFQD